MSTLADVNREISVLQELPRVLERICIHAKTMTVYPDVGISGDIIRSGKAEIVNDVTGDARAVHIPGTQKRETGTESLMCAPLFSKNTVIGLIVLWRNPRVEGFFVQTDLDFLVGLSRQAVIAIQNAQLFVEARKAREAAEAANQAKSIFFANMSHELRTPLNAILGFTQIMGRDTTLSGKHLEDLKIINRSGEHLLTLINLISNALKFTERGSIVTTVALGNSPAPGKGDSRSIPLIFSIEDTGPGLTQSEQNGLFDAFFQAEAGKKFQEGTGLGLPISREFIKLMNGDIRVESKVGEGSAFVFTIRVTKGRDSHLKTSGKNAEASLPASVFDEDGVGLMAAGCDDFLKKPLKDFEVLDRMHQHLGVDYVYKNPQEPKVKIRPASKTANLSWKAFAAQPYAWRDALEKALYNIDLDRVMDLRDQLITKDPSLADALTNALDQIEYEQILKLLQKAKEQK